MTRCQVLLRASLILLLHELLPIPLIAQASYTASERHQGYAIRGDTTFLVFDAQLHGVTPHRVSVTGSMRQWNQNMDDKTWTLLQTDDPGLWQLQLVNPGERNLTAGTEFKFRVDEGQWLEPPASAPNRKNGNLVFLHEVTQVSWKAELTGPRDIRLLRAPVSGHIDRSPAAYALRDSEGQRVDIIRVLYIRPGEVRLVPEREIDIRRVWHLECQDSPPLVCSFDGWFRHLYSNKPLGATIAKDGRSTTFRIFSPRADLVRLYLYHQRVGDKAFDTLDMNRDETGVWETTINRNAEGLWYDFTVHGPAEPGTEFYSTTPVHVTDPYARVSDDSHGRCRVQSPTKPASGLRNGIPHLEDVVAYEVHIEDFTLDLPGLPEGMRGTFSGFAVPGLRNRKGAPVGLDHLTRLGINVVHLLPVQEYLHYPDEEWQASFRDDPYMKERGINLTNYDWGYRTSHAFALETRYREKGTDFGAQNAQFRNMVQVLHDSGIAVIVDVVFNHTAERMDARVFHHHFSVLDRVYYYRTNDSMQLIGDYGSETKSENRPMTARWIIDQCRALIDEYGVDGFRIDLAGLTDKQTLLDLKREIGPDKIVYEEPWIASADPAYEADPDLNWYKKDAPITFFQDDTRNALCGPPDSPVHKQRDRGYAGGNGNREAAQHAIANSFPDERTPNDGMNYLDIHDNWTLADRFAEREWNGELGVEEDRYRIAAAMLLTSLGPVVLHGGSEFMRSKGSAPNEEVVKHTSTGPVWLHGKRDTYNMRTPNLFRWDLLGRNKNDGAPCNYQMMADYWRGLIALRKSAAGACLRIGSTPPIGYIQWITPPDSLLLGYIIDSRLMVLINTSDAPARLDFTLPEGQWTLVVDDDQAGTTAITGRDWSLLSGQDRHSVKLPARSVRIWINK